MSNYNIYLKTIKIKNQQESFPNKCGENIEIFSKNNGILAIQSTFWSCLC